MKFATGVSTLAFFVTSAALVMVLWPIVSEAPWEENDWSTLAAPAPKEVTSPPLPYPGGQPTLGGKIDSLERWVSAFQHHIHSYKSTDVSHSHDLQRGLWGDSYSISAH
jgi:hypothetical protein